VNTTTMSLKGELVEIAGLNANQKNRLFELMCSYFDGIRRSLFEKDLSEKRWAILLRNGSTGQIDGFSTQCVMDEMVEGQPVRAIYSGDTIVDRSSWGSHVLARTWIQFAFAQVRKEPSCHWYWFLVCKGYRTYRYLPVYFQRYHPSPQSMTAFERAVLNRLGHRRFGECYDPRSGVIGCPEDYHLKPGVGDITARELRNPQIAFFLHRNPDWIRGAELACLADLSTENLKPSARRMLETNPSL